ncbi:hypothetical protein CBW52_09905 [Yersinia kristensenii]|uniref:Uncharacterized protein n=1 Tax=Yersinia kristensenii TaxID=28152 RepID=A0AB73PPB2_YERKR|nr:hypothetical protein CBW52_09905 [Yersinia kristensenii]PHZ37799.1 hypothetical protein CS536_01190 [Yersinia kristensenii]PJE85333.1 hypothetical protein CU276_03205 [Yersinia kristensenii]
MIVVQLSPYLLHLNRAGGQAGSPAPAACAKYYCYSQCPPAVVGLIEPARFAPAQARFSPPSMAAHSGHRLCR